MIWQDRNISECFKVFYVKLYVHSLVDSINYSINHSVVDILRKTNWKVLRAKSFRKCLVRREKTVGTIRAAYVESNIEVRSCNSCCSGKAMSVTTIWVCVCSVRYPAWIARAPYCHLWPAQLYNIFPHYLINGAVFGKRLLIIKCVFWFSLQSLSETFLILRKNERVMIKTVYRSSCTVPAILVRS